MRVYLDNCCFNRPYDEQTQIKIALETHAKLYIQNLIYTKKLDLVWSYILEFENAQNTNEGKKDSILKWKSLAISFIKENDEILSMSKTIMSTGVKNYDALHVSCAIYGNCDAFLTVDKRLLKYQTDKIQVCNPIDFIIKYGDELK